MLSTWVSLLLKSLEKNPDFCSASGLVLAGGCTGLGVLAASDGFSTGELMGELTGDWAGSLFDSDLLVTVLCCKAGIETDFGTGN